MVQSFRVINIENNIIRGSEIVNFSYSGESINLIDIFEVNIREAFFIVENLLPNTDWNSNSGNMIEKKEFIYCKDVNGKLFTLLDCEIIPNDIFLNKFTIVWNKMIYGCHIENEEALNVKKIECIINDERIHCNMVIGNNNYKIENGEIEVNTDRNSVVENSINKVLGSRICLKSEKIMPFNRFYKAFQNLICMYYFYIGFFPSKIQVKSEYNEEEIIVYSANRSVCNTSNKFKNFNNIISYEKEDLSVCYEKWVKLYEKNKFVFNMFFNAQFIEEAFAEVVTFSFIQCLESFYSSSYNVKKFEKTKKTEIIRELKTQVRKNEKIADVIKEIDNYSMEELVESIDGMLGRLNQLSLRKIIDNILNSPEGKIVFKYEHSIGKLFKDTANKLYNHRNFIAHISNKNDYFQGEENRLIQNKLILLFRAFVLSNIGSEFAKDYLPKVSEYIDKIYRN